MLGRTREVGNQLISRMRPFCISRTCVVRDSGMGADPVVLIQTCPSRDSTAPNNASVLARSSSLETSSSNRTGDVPSTALR